MNNVGELTGRDYVLMPSFRLLTEEEMTDKARKDSLNICAMYNCENPQDDPWNRFCYAHRKEREDWLRRLGWYDY